MKMTSGNKGFTLVELLATIAIMAVLIVAALPYVADYTSWARATSQARDAQVVAAAIARWIAVGGTVNSAWTVAHPAIAWSASSKAVNIITALATTGMTIGNSGFKSLFLAPNTSWTVLGGRIKIAFTSKTNYTVTGRTH